MKTTHCILYCWLDNNNRDPKETTGNCLDYHDSNGRVLPCREAIEKGYCCKKRTTPVN